MVYLSGGPARGPGTSTRRAAGPFCQDRFRFSRLSGGDSSMNAQALSISVVVPAYNAARHITAALESVCGQELLPGEIIVVDDGSTDGTAEVAAAVSPLVRCQRQPNAGVAAARNTGIRLAAGTCVAFLDADDHWDPGHLADLARAVTELPVRWAASAFTVSHGADGPEDSVLALAGYAGTEPVVLEDYFSACAGTWTVWTSACLVDTALLRELGGFDESLRTGEDLDLWFRIALREPALGYCPRPSVVYRQVPDSLTHRQSRRGYGFYEGLRRMKSQVPDPAGRRRIRPLLVRYANSAARVAGRNADRATARQLLRRDGDLLAPSVRLRLAAALLLPGRWAGRLWGVRG